MSLKIDPNTASKKVNEYLNEVDDLLNQHYVDGYSKKSDLKSRIKAFITVTFDDSVKKLRSFSPRYIDIFTVGAYVESNVVDKKELRQEYINDLNDVKRHLIGYKEEISLILASQKHSIENNKDQNKTIEEETLDITSSNIFISHGKRSEALDLLTEFIEAIGLNPVVVMNQPNQGMSIDNKVKTQIERCEAVIVLATGDDRVSATLQPRQNIIHEIGYAEKDLDNKIIYLLEERAKFPSNISKAYTRFTKDNLTKAFIAITRDLKSFGII